MPIETLTVVTGQRIPEAEARTLDPAHMSVAVTGALAPAEVEGQAIYGPLYARCPWCGHVDRALTPKQEYAWYRCGGCGGACRF